MTQVLKLESKTAKILYAVIAGIIVHFIWFNTNIVTDYFNIARASALGLTIKALLLILAVFVFTAVVIKTQRNTPLSRIGQKHLERSWNSNNLRIATLYHILDFRKLCIRRVAG